MTQPVVSTERLSGRRVDGPVCKFRASVPPDRNRTPHRTPMTVRYRADEGALVEAAAVRLGIRKSEFIREASILRASHVMGDGEILARLLALEAEVARLRKLH